jgi:hypothetical protein
MSRISEYFSAIYHDWMARMSGVASVVLAVVGLIWPSYFGDIHHLRTAMWIASALCLVFASFRIWLGERKALEAEKGRNVGSDLRGSIRLGYIDKQRLSPKTGWEDISQGCLVTVYVDVVNHNPQIAYPRADRSTLQIEFNGISHQGTWQHIVDGLTVNDDRLVIKTVSDWFDGLFQGLPQSLPRLGYMQFLVPSLSNDLLFGRDSIVVEATVTIVDTLDKKHSIRNEGLALIVDKLDGSHYLHMRKKTQ